MNNSQDEKDEKDEKVKEIINAWHTTKSLKLYPTADLIDIAQYLWKIDLKCRKFNVFDIVFDEWFEGNYSVHTNIFDGVGYLNHYANLARKDGICILLFDLYPTLSCHYDILEVF